MQMFKHQSSSLSQDVDIPIHVVLDLPITTNATTAIELDTSLPCAKCPKTPNIQQSHLSSAKSPEGGHKDLPAEEEQVGHPAEEDTHIEVPPTTQASQDIQVPVKAHHRTTTAEDHHVEGDAAPTPFRHQVSHIMSFNSYSNEDQLYMDRAPYGPKSFHTTLQLFTKQGCKSLPVKVDPGADINTIPLSQYITLFPNHFTRDGQLKKNALRSMASTWSPHDGTTKQFLGYFTIDIQHKTSPQILPLTFYISKDISRPFTLISYPVSIHLGIVDFKVPNEAGTHPQVSSVTNTPNTKNVSFNDLIH